MRHSLRFCVLPALLVLICVAQSYGGGAVMPRQAIKGTLIVLSNVEREDYEEVLARLRPKYALWIDPATPRDEVALPPGPLAMMLFLMRSDPDGVAIHPSWYDDLPVAPADLSFANAMIAAKTVHPPKTRWYVAMLVIAPTARLLEVTLKEAMLLRGFPLARPISHDLVDLRDVRAVACLPSVTGAATGAVGRSGEAALYRALIDLQAFHIVGREALPIAGASGIMTVRGLRRLSRELRVQAAAFVEITGAETICEEHTEYKKSRKKAVSGQHQADFDELKRKLEAQGRTVVRNTPEPDLVWAAPYGVREYTTIVSGQVTVVDAQSGQSLLNYQITGSSEVEEDDDVRTQDYRWYEIEYVYDSDSRDEHEYSVRLRVADASEIVRKQVGQFGAHLMARTMLPRPGDDPFLDYAPVKQIDVVARILAADAGVVFIDLGREQAVRKGDTFDLLGQKELRDPDTGEVIEVVNTQIARLKVVEIYEKTSRCEVIEGTADPSWVGLIVASD